jgi:hypothetical protein
MVHLAILILTKFQKFTFLYEPIELSPWRVKSSGVRQSKMEK